MNKYRVVSITWVDVYADDVHKARQIAGDIYYDMTPEEQDALPNISFTRPFGDPSVTLDSEDHPGWRVWSPSNEPF